jgi:RNA polymerase sigma factor (sigma-70 family)
MTHHSSNGGAPNISGPDDIIKLNMGLIVSQVRSFCGPRHNDFEDYIQIGCMAVVKCYDSYDESKARWTTYACSCIRNALKNELRKKQRNIKTVNIDNIDEEKWYYDTNINDSIPENLEDNERQILDLKIAGYTRKEIAEITGQSSKSVRYQITRLLKKLRQINET